MATSIRSARLREIADGLRSLASMLEGQSDHVGRVVTSATAHVGTVRGVWAGPRAVTTLTAGDAYLTAVAPASGAFASAGDIVRRLATTADDIAGSMEPHERTITDMDWYRFAGIEPDEDLSDRYDAAGPALESLEADWLRAEATATAQLETDLRTLGAAHDAFVAGFASTVLTGTAYLAHVLRFAAAFGVALGRAERLMFEASDEELLSFLLSTGVGSMCLDIIETMNEDAVTDTDSDTSSTDIDIAATNEELVRQRVLDWAEENGYELDPATVDYFTGQIMLTAGAMQRSDDDPWNDVRTHVSGPSQAVLDTVAELPPDVALDVISVEDDPATTAAWWQTVPPATAATLIETRSPVVGNLNGLPAGVRDEANRTQLDRDLALAEQDELTAEEEAVLANAEATQANLEKAEQFDDPLDGGTVVVQLFVYEPAAFEGDGRVAVAIGNVDTADHVAVNVPGFLSEVEGMDPQRAYNVYGEARFASGDSVAVIDWMGYNAPNPGGDDGVADASNVLDMGAAEAGATLLADDVAGIVAMRPDDGPHLTVVGNSYGSTTVAIAADERGLQADDVILTGSPGAGNADTAADFTTGTDHTWVASSSTDAVTYFGHSDGSIRLFGALGDDPAMDDFEAQRIQAENVDRDNPVNPLNVPGQHGAYYNDDSESLFNIGVIVGGEYDRVLPADHRHQQPVLELQNPVLPGDGPFWQFRLSWPLDVNAPWPTDPEAGREPELHSSTPDAIPEEDGDDEDEEVA